MHRGIRLVSPCFELSDTHASYISEFVEREEALVPWVLKLDATDFHDYVARLIGFSHGVGIKDGFVEHSTFWMVDAENTIVGVSNLRHRLTPELERIGGNIGFSVRPSKRRQGYATHLLALTLDAAKSLPIGRVLLTCDEENTGSRKAIMANGGVLHTADEGIRRYWITLA